MVVSVVCKTNPRRSGNLLECVRDLVKLPIGKKILHGVFVCRIKIKEKGLYKERLGINVFG